MAASESVRKNKNIQNIVKKILCIVFLTLGGQPRPKELGTFRTSNHTFNPASHRFFLTLDSWKYSGKVGCGPTTVSRCLNYTTSKLLIFTFTLFPIQPDDLSSMLHDVDWKLTLDGMLESMGFGDSANFRNIAALAGEYLFDRYGEELGSMSVNETSRFSYAQAFGHSELTHYGPHYLKRGDGCSLNDDVAADILSLVRRLIYKFGTNHDLSPVSLPKDGDRVGTVHHPGQRVVSEMGYELNNRERLMKPVLDWIKKVPLSLTHMHISYMNNIV